MARPKTDLSEIASMAALGGASGLDDEMKELLREALKEKLDERKAAIEADQAWRKANAAEIKESRAATAAARAACPHRKENQQTALAGQHIGGGKFCFVCLHCQAEFHKPAEKGQIEPPMALIPTEHVGGPVYA